MQLRKKINLSILKNISLFLLIIYCCLSILFQDKNSFIGIDSASNISLPSYFLGSLNQIFVLILAMPFSFFLTFVVTTVLVRNRIKFSILEILKFYFIFVCVSHFFFYLINHEFPVNSPVNYLIPYFGLTFLIVVMGFLGFSLVFSFKKSLPIVEAQKNKFFYPTEKLPMQIIENKVEIKVPNNNLKKAIEDKPVLEKIEKEVRLEITEGFDPREVLKQFKNDDTSNQSPEEEYFQNIRTRIEEKIAEFKIHGKIINVLKGPVVDTYELELGAGIKVSRISSIAEDLSLALSGAPIRIVYPLKGRTTLGIEVPRSPREIIYLTDLLADDDFSSSNYRVPIVLGKDAFGRPFMQDLVSMPHMLVAGATGAGKSVFINSLLVSLLMKLTPKNLKLILIDPKQLELSLYGKLKHLLLPVITSSSKTAAALIWACDEMERRYELLSRAGVRNIDGYNLKNVDGENLPFIVIVIDEFADLILSKNGKDIENNVCRLAAKARAAGIHMIVATQRPSVDVITGLIKSNFPTRVSFRVTSSIDSRTILNASGAEKLLGMGDMLYKTGVEMIRVHSPYIHEDDIEKIVSHMSLDEPLFDDEIVSFIEEKENEELVKNGEKSESGNSNYVQNLTDQEDVLYNEAIKIAFEYKSASASMLQRRLKVGYNRAANLIDMMERRGIVGPQQGAKPRELLGNGSIF